MFSSIKIYFFIVLLGLGGGVVWYYKSTQATIMELTQYNAELTATIDEIEGINEQNIENIERLRADNERQREQFISVQALINNIRQQNAELRDRLGEHDIGALAAAKPGLVERVINNASSKAMRCFELESGAPLTEQERSAKNAKAFNSECPWIYDDLVARGLLIVPSDTTADSSN